jgi:broad specificity phosphatase PhoE
MRRVHWPLGLTACLVGAIACARPQAAAPPSPTRDATEAPAPAESVVLEVENHNWSDIVVYVSHDGMVTRLAQVTANTTTSLSVPPYLVGSLGLVRLAVRRIGGTDSYASEPISVRTGSTLRLTVETRVATSSVAVW